MSFKSIAIMLTAGAGLVGTIGGITLHNNHRNRAHFLAASPEAQFDSVIRQTVRIDCVDEATGETYRPDVWDVESYKKARADKACSLRFK